jgi:hypothetical protein
LYLELRKRNTITIHSAYFLVLPLILSAITNLWNPVGFPSFHVDEGIYMGRAMHVLDGNGPLERTDVRTPYDHPFFGQIFLAVLLGLIGYPDSLGLSSDVDVQSIEMLHLVPRVVMGMLAVVDTFLVYKVANVRYNNRTIAFISAILFAVMPITWILRRILLDNLLLPLLLSSILFSLYTRKPVQTNNIATGRNVCLTAILAASLSGAFLGLSIFTKIPAFTFIPLVGFLIFTNSNRNRKIFYLWLVPVIMIPAIWPIYSIINNQFDEWIYGVEFQSRREGKPLIGAMDFFFDNDPLLLILGLSGLIFAAFKRDYFVLLWAIPFLLFLYIQDWVTYFHLAPIIPVLCLAAAVMLTQLFRKMNRTRHIIRKLIPYSIIGSVIIFGFISSFMLISTNVSYGYSRLYAFIIDYLPHYSANGLYTSNDSTKSVVVGWYWTELFVWIPKYILDKDTEYIKENNDNILSLLQGNRNVIFLADRNIKDSIEKGDEILRVLYNSTNPILTIDDKGIDEYDRSSFPYNNLNANRDIGTVTVRANF